MQLKNDWRSFWKQTENQFVKGLHLQICAYVSDILYIQSTAPKPFKDCKARIVTMALFGHNLPTDIELFKPSTAGVGNLFTLTGRMNCALSLAGHNIKLILSQNPTFI